MLEFHMYKPVGDDREAELMLEYIRDRCSDVELATLNTGESCVRVVIDDGLPVAVIGSTLAEAAFRLIRVLDAVMSRTLVLSE